MDDKNLPLSFLLGIIFLFFLLLEAYDVALFMMLFYGFCEIIGNNDRYRDLVKKIEMYF